MKTIFSLLVICLFSITTIIRADDSIRCDINFSKSNTCVQIDWVYGPYLDQYNSLKITYSDSNLVNSINVIPWMVMSSHEHGSRPVVLTKTGDREFLVEKAYFMGGMDGQWYLKIQLLDSSKFIIDENRYLINFKQ